MAQRSCSPTLRMSSVRTAIVWPTALLAVAFLGGSARAQFTSFQATINQAQEVPPTGSASTGFGLFAFNASTNMLDYSITITPLASGQTAQHLHQGVPGVAGPVILPLPGGLAISGTLAIPAAQVVNLLAGNTYVNFHSTAFPGGEIRGQVIVPSSTGVSFCDPSTEPALDDFRRRISAAASRWRSKFDSHPGTCCSWATSEYFTGGERSLKAVCADFIA